MYLIIYHKLRIENTKFIGVCRSEKKNCDENISIDISKDNTKISELIASTASVIYLAPPQNWIHRFNLRNFLANVNKKKYKNLYILALVAFMETKKTKL